MSCAAVRDACEHYSVELIIHVLYGTMQVVEHVFYETVVMLLHILGTCVYRRVLRNM